ncbi:DUF2690 domain-containing protein [Shimazuella kribbensis]|uniref:DUF2690 domain-containing protein n=1 Tax=Shimazuella kribbensis TaxID=139808 RepID=UPI000427AE91|nr:DUF2690 domain-containing protein [Shimazuella kribbensis]
MKVKRFLNIGFVFALAFSFFVASFALNPIGADAAQYDGTNPYNTGCAYNQPVTYDTEYLVNNSGTRIGYVQLKGSAGCHTAWAYIKLYNAAPKDYYAETWIKRRYNTTQSLILNKTLLDCDKETGGNGVIMKGETSCFTGQAWDKSPYNAQASGVVYDLWNSKSTGWY